LSNNQVISQFKEEKNSPIYEIWVEFLTKLLREYKITEIQFEELINLDPINF